MSPKVSTTYRAALLLCTILLVELISANMERPQRNNEISNMADALKYIQELDSYYADKARTRYGKRNANVLMEMLHNRAMALQQARQRYNNVDDWNENYAVQQ